MRAVQCRRPAVLPCRRMRALRCRRITAVPCRRRRGRGRGVRQERPHGRLAPREQRARVQAHPEDHRDQRHEDREFLSAEVRHRGEAVANGTVEDAADEREEVGRRRDHAERRQDRGGRTGLEGPQQDQELADEAVRAREGQGGQGDDHRRRRERRRARPGAAVAVGVRTAGAGDQHPRDEEQRPGADAVIDHLDETPLQRGHIEREDAQQDEPHMAHAPVGQQPAHVPLRPRDRAAVQDADDRQDGQERPERPHRLREEREAEPQQPVRAGLGHDGGQQHGDDRGRLRVRVGEPRVQRPDRHLDREGRGERQEQHGLIRPAEPQRAPAAPADRR